MRVKFTKRSEKDTYLVTMSLAQFDYTDLDHYGALCSNGREVVVVIEGIPTLFRFARPNSKGMPTVATTRSFPRSLRMPRVGRPVYADVSAIRSQEQV